MTEKAAVKAAAPQNQGAIAPKDGEDGMHKVMTNSEMFAKPSIQVIPHHQCPERLQRLRQSHARNHRHGGGGEAGRR